MGREETPLGMNTSRPRLYLANPLGFTELGLRELDNIQSRLGEHFDVIEPFQQSRNLGTQLQDLEQSNLPLGTLKERMSAINQKIGKRNKDDLDTCHVVVAVLDYDDNGTAAEIGYAFARQKPIWGYLGDFRQRGDNLGVCINLQVQFFIEASGGKICRTLDELCEKLEIWLKTVWIPRSGIA